MTSIIFTSMNLNYKAQGEGFQIILLHGIFGSLDNWQSFSNKLANSGYKVISVDLRNHGRSEHSSEFTYYDMSEDISGLIRKLDLHKPVILGHSLGGKVAMTTAIQYPEITSGIIIVDIAPRHYPILHASIINALNKINLEDLKSRKEAEELMSTSISNIKIRQFLLKNLYRVENGFNWRLNLEVIEANIENVGEEVEFDSPCITPALFIKGENSDYITYEDEREIFEIFEDVHISVCSDASHWVHADNPDCLLELTNRFLTRFDKVP